MTRLPTIARACGLAVALEACATGNTPQQNLAYERWARCGSAYVQLERIEVDGRITFQHTSSAERESVFRCLAEAGRGAAALPEPRAVRPPGGP